MKVLIFGPSGAGKTYVSQALKQQGINAYDDSEIDNLSGWYNRQGQPVPPSATAREALDNLQKERLLHTSRPTPLMDFDEQGMVTWGDWLGQEAQKRNIPFIDATLSPNEIFAIINK